MTDYFRWNDTLYNQKPTKYFKYDVVDSELSIEQVLFFNNYNCRIAFGHEKLDYPEKIANHIGIVADRIEKYKNTLILLKELGYNFLTGLDLHTKDESKKIVHLRHDIDGDLFASIMCAQVLYDLKISGSFYVLHTSPYYGHWNNGVFHRNNSIAHVLRHLQNLGQEVGLHTDGLGIYLNKGVNGSDAVRTELEWLKSEGINIRGTAPHNGYEVHNACNSAIFSNHSALASNYRVDLMDMKIRDSASKGGMCFPLGTLEEKDFGLLYEDNDIYREIGKGRFSDLIYVSIYNYEKILFANWLGSALHKDKNAKPIIKHLNHNDLFKNLNGIDTDILLYFSVHPEYYGNRCSEFEFEFYKALPFVDHKKAVQISNDFFNPQTVATPADNDNTNLTKTSDQLVENTRHLPLIEKAELGPKTYGNLMLQHLIKRVFKRFLKTKLIRKLTFLSCQGVKVIIDTFRSIFSKDEFISSIDPLSRDVDYYKSLGLEHKYFVQNLLTGITEKNKFSSQITHLEQLADDNYRFSYNFSVVRVLASALYQLKIKRKKKIRILDFGCWSGATTRYLSNLLGIPCDGAEIDKDCLEFSRKYLASSITNFIDVNTERINSADASYDVILANAVFANMFPDQHLPMVKELIRVTKPGGFVVIIDSNNPESPNVQARLKDLYQKLEGPGGSYLLARQSFIDSLRPVTTPNLEAAKATCYRTQQEIREFLDSELNPSFFDPNSIKAPFSLQAPICAPSTATPWRQYQQVMIEAGMSVVCGASYPATTEPTTEDCFVLLGKKKP